MLLHMINWLATFSIQKIQNREIPIQFQIKENKFLEKKWKRNPKFLA